MPIGGGVNNFVPRLEFPNGDFVPLANLEVRINGVIVTAEFDVSTGGTPSSMTISGDVTAHPVMLAALKEGLNTFQVTNPLKEKIFFTDKPNKDVFLFSNMFFRF